MLTLTHYQNLQRTFYSRISKNCNKAVAKIELKSFTSVGKFPNFTGDNPVGTSTILEVQCLYSRNITAKMRDKYGISENVDTIVHISPLAIAKLTGSPELDPKIMKNKSRISVTLFDVVYTVDQIIENEPMLVNGINYIISYEFRLNSKTTSNV